MDDPQDGIDIKPKVSFLCFTGESPSELEADFSLGGSSLCVNFCSHHRPGPLRDRSWQIFASEQCPEAGLTMGSGVVSPIAQTEGQLGPSGTPAETRVT